MKDEFKTMGGIFYIKAVNPDGSVIERQMHNKMTTASLAAISGLVGNTGSQNAFTYLEVGTSSTAVSTAHTALQAAITDTGLARASATITRQTTTSTNDTLQLVYSWTATGSKTIEEVGVFNASSAGVMLCRALTGSITVQNATILTITYKWVAVVN